MNPSGNAVIRMAAMAIVLILAAVLGLVAGNALNARDGGAISPGAAAGPHLSGFDGARYEALESAAAGTPAYADPYRQLIQNAGQAALPDTVFPNVWGNVTAPEPVTSESWGNIASDAGADDAFPQTWGNLDERHDAHPSTGTSVRDSLTAPALR